MDINMEINVEEEDISLDGFDSYISHLVHKCTMGKFSELCKLIGKCKPSLRSAEEWQINSVLEELEYNNHTLAVLDILFLKYQRPITAESWGFLYKVTKEFLMDCSEAQIQYCPEIFTEVCHQFATRCLEQSLDFSAILPLSNAIDKITSNDRSHLTRIHADLVLVCLQAKCLKKLLPYIDCDITNIDSECNMNGCESFLLYYYYGAIAFITMKKFKQAFYFLEIVISTPCLVVSYIMLEAYRKYILVSLILYEKFDSLPNCVSTVVNKYFKNLCLPYIELSKSFERYELTSFTANMNKYDEIFIKDSNFTFVQQVKEHLRVMRIKRMRNVFVNISLHDMVAYLNEESVHFIETKLQELILAGELHASIDTFTDIVHFPNHTNVINGRQLNDLVDEQIKECIEMENQISHIDDKVLPLESFHEQIIDKDLQIL